MYWPAGRESPGRNLPSQYSKPQCDFLLKKNCFLQFQRIFSLFWSGMHHCHLYPVWGTHFLTRTGSAPPAEKKAVSSEALEGAPVECGVWIVPCPAPASLHSGAEAAWRGEGSALRDGPPSKGARCRNRSFPLRLSAVLPGDIALERSSRINLCVFVWGQNSVTYELWWGTSEDALHSFS